MNLMIVIDDLFRGGTEQTLKSRLHYLPPDWGVSIVVLYAKGAIGEEIENGGISVVCMDLATNGYVKTIFNVRKKVKEFNPDIILFMRDVSRGLLPFFITGNGKKVLFWDNTIIYKSFRQFYSEFFQVKVGKAYFLCSSDAIAENLKKYYNRKNIKIISNCYDERLFRFKDILKNSNRKEKRILSVGSMRSEKNHAAKIEIAKILKSRNIKFTLDIMGRGDFSSIKKIINDYNLNKEVNIIGEVSDLYEIIHNYDLFLMTSHTEGSPVALLEALASGLPCVVYSFYGLESLRQIDNVIFNVKNKTASEAADTIIKIINQNDDTMIKYLENASQFAFDNYSSENNATEWMDYLFSLISN